MACTLRGQEVHLNGYGAYGFDDKVESYYSSTNYFNGLIKGGAQYGLGIEFKVHHEYGLEFLYLRQDTKAEVHYYDMSSALDRDAAIDLQLNWVLASAVRYLTENRSFEPYAGGMVGVAIINGTNPVNEVSQSATKFAWGVRCGANVWVSNHLGFKFQLQLLSATQAAGGGLYFGTGGTGAGVSTYSSMFQFGAGGGVAVRLGSTRPKPTRNP